jgi:membrane-associated phospholipid phosphatase
MTDPLNFRNCKWYFLGLIILYIAGFVLLLQHGKGGSFILLNSYHTKWTDVFFINYTNAGDGIFTLFITAVLFLYKRKKQALALLLSFLLSGLLAQIFKNLITSPRPKLFFTAGQYNSFFDGITLANYSSFPSGHTASAFAAATVLALTMRNKKGQLPLLMAAALVGYSRIYLAQHFLTDVMVGAFFGITAGIYMVYLVNNSNRFGGLSGKKKQPGADNTLSSTSEVNTA